MLLRFAVQNHRSLFQRQELSMVASSLNDSEAGLIDTGSGVRLVPAAVIYGANASGKSNVISAIRWMRSAVLLSHRQGEPGGGVPRNPFALDVDAREEPTTCDIDFILNDVRYNYGFNATNSEFSAEWLRAFPNNRRQSLFERREMKFHFGRALKGGNKVIEKLTRPNSLFLSAATQNSHEELSRIAEVFRNLSIIDETETISSRQLSEQDNHAVDSRIIAYLGGISGGIIGYKISRMEMDDRVKEFQREIEGIMKKLFNPTPEVFLDDGPRYTVKLSHINRYGNSVEFDFEDESDGTRRLFSLLVHIFRALDTGATIFIDELSASLHTLAGEALLALFSSPTTNPKGAQLIATTHDTNLLRSSLLRRDQIWFTEKDREGSTHLYPLTDIRTRKGDNIERGYLQGRYGAIPFAGSAIDLVAAD